MPLLTKNRQKLIIIVALVVSLPSFALIRGVKNSNHSLVSARELVPANSPGEQRRTSEGYRPRSKRNHQAAAAIDPRGLPSALPKRRQNSAAPQQHHQQGSPSSGDGTMRVDKSLPKRPAGSESASTHEMQRKRFKMSGRLAADSSEANSFAASDRHSDLLRKNNTLIEGHLNRITSRTTTTTSINQQDLNNNSIESEPQRSSWRQNINSVNGTVDLSQYNQADVDRLYGDALLVYFKNFNETLPARRETLNINGTSPDKTPVYRSVSSLNK